jgi:hypothetical protein
MKPGVDLRIKGHGKLFWHPGSPQRVHVLEHVQYTRREECQGQGQRTSRGGEAERNSSAAGAEVPQSHN